MTQKFFNFLCALLVVTTCAFIAGRYSTNMQNANELPKELSTAHEVIVTMSAFIHEQASKIEKLTKELTEAQAAFAKLLAGNRSEKFVNPAQQLLEFPDDKELQAVLDAAKREAEEALQKITYTRSTRKEKTKLRSDEFPAHFRREEVTIAIPADKQKLIDEGKLILLHYEAREVMCYKPAETFIKRFLEPVFATTEAPAVEAFRVEMPAALGEQGKYDSSVSAYSGNLSVVLAPGSSMTRMACWSHARRHVYEAREVDLSDSAMPLALINQLYDIERRALDWPNDQRTAERENESKLILSRLGEWLDGPVAKSVLPASKLAAALNYVRNHWDALNAYAVDGALPIDNNWVERLMKRVAVGKKNWLFIGSLRAGIRNANLMTMVASAHRQDLDVQEYLRDVIEHLNRGTAPPSELLPDVWKASHPEAVRTYREVERRDKAELARLRNANRRLLK